MERIFILSIPFISLIIHRYDLFSESEGVAQHFRQNEFK